MVKAARLGRIFAKRPYTRPYYILVGEKVEYYLHVKSHRASPVRSGPRLKVPVFWLMKKVLLDAFVVPPNQGKGTKGLVAISEKIPNKIEA